MSLIREIKNEAEFQSELAAAGVKLVVADFTATWCGPCQRIAPVFLSYANKYLNAVFLKVDVDKCQETAAKQRVSAMPTFVFYKNKTEIGRVQGSDPIGLEDKIKQYYDPLNTECDVSGHLDLNSFILKDKCSVLNEVDGQTVKDVLEDSERFVESSCDAELIFSFTFSTIVKMHSLKFKAPRENGPKTIKLFVNMASNLDFDTANRTKALQELELTPDDLDGRPVNLKFVKFQNINTIDIFISKNQDDSDVTRVDYIGFIGSPYNYTNMDEFKRVAGKKGESHY